MYKKEIIGKMIQVTQARNKDLTGIKGKVLDETRNTVVVGTQDGRKKVLKQGAAFKIGGEDVRGEDLDARPEERVKG